MRLCAFQRVILESVIRLRESRISVLVVESGYSNGTCERALHDLRKMGLLEPKLHAGFYVATERGKIVLAIIQGQEARRQHQKAELDKAKADYKKKHDAWLAVTGKKPALRPVPLLAS